MFKTLKFERRFQEVRMEDNGTLPFPSRPDLLRAALDADLPAVYRRAKRFSRARTESYHERLASYHHLTEDSAQRLELEYRRYLYLKAVHGGVLTPSKRVDQAWHLHMETPGADWDGFCGAWFGTKIDHVTGLSPEEARTGYGRSLDLYWQEFGQRPPKDIWPDNAVQAQARKARWIRWLGTGIALLAFGALFLSSKVAGGSDAVPSESTGDLTFILIFFSGIGLGMLGENLAKGTDLEEVASCG
jgi:hypothetical protein